LQRHIEAFPVESSPIHDTANALGGKPREPNPTKDFIPVGHISLDTEYETPNLLESKEGQYIIATFYVSNVLQGSGLGRAAMDAVEQMAISKPLFAKTLALSTVANEYKGKDEKWALGRERPKASGNQRHSLVKC
jgi:hypothetical protein